MAGLQKSTGGVAYDYILKPAADNAPKISSPPKDKPLTHDEIFEKLKKAEARRQVSLQKSNDFLTNKQGYNISTSKLISTKKVLEL